MNKEEAIEVLQKNYPDSRYSMLREAVDMAIEALEIQDICAEMLESAKPVSTDGVLISRQDIKYHVQLEAMGNGQYEKVEVAYKDDIESLPSATCDDCIWHTCNYNKVDWDGEDGEA